MENKTKQAVLSLSGGMDSSTLLLHLLSKGYEVTALSFDYGQKHKIELERASELVNYNNHTIDNLDFDKKIQWVMRNRDIELENLYVTEAANNMTQIKHQIIKLDGLSQLLNSSLVEGGTEVPEGHYEQDNMKETVVPNRNKIFSSIVQAVALSIADKNETNCVIALGLHSGDHTIYPDTTEEFRLADLNAFKIGNWGSDKVDFYTPYMESNKFGILQDGEKCCKQLDLDFNEIYKRTNTSYKPMKHNGVWYSDYKSASSVERIEAFIKLGLPDPVEYADETGPVTWEVAKKHVEQILDSHK